MIPLLGLPALPEQIDALFDAEPPLEDAAAAAAARVAKAATDPEGAQADLVAAAEAARRVSFGGERARPRGAADARVDGARGGDLDGNARMLGDSFERMVDPVAYFKEKYCNWGDA